MAWLSGWSHRKTITITGRSGAGTNYQVNLSIGDASGGDFHLESHCTSFPNDITVTDNDQTTLLDHWVEDPTVDPISMWVEVADSLSSNVDVCVYYDKSGESSASNITNTFLFGDDIEDGTTNKWTDETNSNFVATINPVKYGTYAGHHYASDDWAESYATFTSFSNDGVVDVWLRKGETNLRSDFLIELTGGDYSNCIEVYFNSDGKLYYYDGSSHEIWASYNADTWYHFVFTLHSGADYTFDLDIDDVREVTGGGTRGTMSSLTAISVMSGGDASSDLYLDNLFLRKYNSPEPAFSSAGAEENAPTGDVGQLVYGGLVNAGLVGGRLA